MTRAPASMLPDAATTSATRDTACPVAIEIAISGVVQGVGFRPFVHRAALRHGIAGWVRNEAGAVRIVAQGTQERLESLVSSLRTELPPLASIETFEVTEISTESLDGFRVVPSDVAPVGRLPVSPDVGICAACEAELRDPTNRRFGYPFITCTDCGPRFTVIESMPYDRERSTMRAFHQCPECLREYGDPDDRRYHSETNSCWRCGPTVWLEGPATEGAPTPRGPDAIAAAGHLLSSGHVLAVRGLGGFHLAVDATDDEAVQRLRSRKGREAKPLAVMVRDVRAARDIAFVSDGEEATLASRERPIVILGAKPDARLSPSVSPGLESVGVMIAYTPLHHLLLDAVGGRPLVMTSGNVSEEPIAIRNEQARIRLGKIADALLLHDREIVARYDDSVVRVVDDRPVFLRRSRGYAPTPIRLPVAAEEPILAVGPHLKNTFTLATGHSAFVSQHVGDLENLETLKHFEDARDRYRRLFRIEPEWVVCDLHPGYLSTRMADESGLLALPSVQHHHAHIAAVLGEHGLEERVIGLAFDGTGYGDDGNVWGCEFLEADPRGYRRLAHLRYAPLPGGDKAARSPWRTLVGYGSLAEGGAAWAQPSPTAVSPTELSVVHHQLRRRLNTPLASSMGRLFDAAAAALGLRIESAYEAQAAMELEAVAEGDGVEPLPFPIRWSRGALPVLDPVPLLHALTTEKARGAAVGELSARFHEAVARTTSRLALGLCERHGLERVALGGGCFQNARLLHSMRRRLEHGGVDVLTPLALGPNDGAVSYGQAVVAAARLNDSRR